MWMFWNFPGARDRPNQQGKPWTEARVHAECRSNPAHPGVLLLLWRERYTGGSSPFRAAEALKQSDANVISAIGLILRGQGQWGEAIAAFKRARTYDYRSYNLITPLPKPTCACGSSIKRSATSSLATTLAPEVTTAYRDLFRVRLASAGTYGQASSTWMSFPDLSPRESAPFWKPTWPTTGAIQGALEMFDAASSRGGRSGPFPTRPAGDRTLPEDAPSRPEGARPSPEGARPGLGTMHERMALLYHLMGEEELRDAYADSLRLSS